MKRLPRFDKFTAGPPVGLAVTPHQIMARACFVRGKHGFLLEFIPYRDTGQE